MADDPGFAWRLANPGGILVDEATDAWYSGRVNSILELDNGGVLIGTAFAGVWLVNVHADSSTGTYSHDSPTQLGDWDQPDINCLVAGPDGERHIFAGTQQGEIYETNVADPLPLYGWRRIEPGPNAEDVDAIAVFKVLRLIVAACKQGVFWAEIPLFHPPHPTESRGWQWTRAQELVNGATSRPGYWGVAAASPSPREGEPKNRDDALVVAGSRENANPDASGIFSGKWDAASGNLVLTRTDLRDPAGRDINPLQAVMGSVSVASCMYGPDIVYVACRNGINGKLMMVARSRDGGQTFTQCETKLTWHGHHNDMVAVAGDWGGGRNCIAVHPAKSSLVAVGWQHEAPFISIDGGRSWSLPVGNPHQHADINGLHFPRTDGVVSRSLPNDSRLYVGSDGGLLMVSDVPTLAPAHHLSSFNAELPTLLFYENAFNVSAYEEGLIIGGTQDNGNLYTHTGQQPPPWRDPTGGDGGLNLPGREFVVTRRIGQVPEDPMFELLSNGGQLTSNGHTIATRGGPGPNPGSLDNPVGDTVYRPTWKNGARQLMEAVAAQAGALWGLFYDVKDAHYYWQHVAVLPLQKGESATAAASGQGANVFVGTNQGRILAIDARTGGSLDMPLKPIPPPLAGKLENEGYVPRIVARQAAQTAYAVLLYRRYAGSAERHHILRLESLTWVDCDVAGQIGDSQPFTGLDAEWTSSGDIVVACTDSRVYVSRDRGVKWGPASLGLPIRPHGKALRYVADSRGTFVHLATYGRSVWMCRVDANPDAPLFEMRLAGEEVSPTAVRMSSLPLAPALKEAWLDLEHVLPDGWRVVGPRREPEADRWYAFAGPIERTKRAQDVKATGDGEADAVRSLAAALRRER
jgi:hypothetical protein